MRAAADVGEEPSERGEGGNALLVVPRAPGPLIDPDASARAEAPDEIAEAVDDLLGPDPGGSPGWFDAVLLAGGLGLILWAEIAGYSRFFTVLGAIALFLGLILPTRSAWRAIEQRRAGHRRAAVLSRGLALNVDHPLTRRLADEYDALLEATRLPGLPVAGEAARAAHLAVVESASLLHGGLPSNAGEQAYVEKRVEAIATLTRTLRAHHVHAAEARAAGEREERDLDRTARALAGEELDALGVSSLNDLDNLTEVMRGPRA